MWGKQASGVLSNHLRGRVAVPVSEPHFLDLTFQDSPYSMKTTYLKIQVSGVAQGGACSPFRGIFVDRNSVVGTRRAQRPRLSAPQTSADLTQTPNLVSVGRLRPGENWRRPGSQHICGYSGSLDPLQEAPGPTSRHRLVLMAMPGASQCTCHPCVGFPVA